MEDDKMKTCKNWDIRKKLLLGFLLADVMLCTSCGTNATGSADSQNNTEQITAEETNTDDTEVSDQDISDTETTQADTAEKDKTSEDGDTDEVNEFLDRFADIEKQSEELKNSIDHEDLSQTEYNLKSHDLYTLWDGALNDLWKILGKMLPKEDMDALTKEEAAWVEDRDQKVMEAGKEVEGGSMQPMLEDLAGADLTEKRVRELLTRLPGISGTASAQNDSGASGELETQENLLDAFLYHGGSAKVSERFKHDNRMVKACEAGDTFDLAALKSFLQQDKLLEGTEPEIEYANLRYPDRKVYALSLYYPTNIEGFTQFFILSEHNGALEINFALDGWSRRYPSINENGVVFDGGSNGAASHESTIYVPDSDFVYQVLSVTEENGYGYSFYDSNGEPVQTVNDIISEAGGTNPDAMNVLYSQVVIDGRTYYYFLGMDRITQDLVDYIDGIASDHGFTFDGKAAVDAAELAYAQKLGAQDIYNNHTEAGWQEVGKSDDE